MALVAVLEASVEAANVGALMGAVEVVATMGVVCLATVVGSLARVERAVLAALAVALEEGCAPHTHQIPQSSENVLPPSA